MELLVGKPEHRSLPCYPAIGAAVAGAMGTQLVPQILGPRGRTIWMGGESLISWFIQSWKILYLRELLGSQGMDGLGIWSR